VLMVLLFSILGIRLWGALRALGPMRSECPTNLVLERFAGLGLAFVVCVIALTYELLFKYRTHSNERLGRNTEAWLSSLGSGACGGLVLREHLAPRLGCGRPPQSLT
jgi:hypothetical protein